MLANDYLRLGHGRNIITLAHGRAMPAPRYKHALQTQTVRCLFAVILKAKWRKEYLNVSKANLNFFYKLQKFKLRLTSLVGMQPFSNAPGLSTTE